MKTKLNILCFLLLIAFAGCMYNAFLGGMEGASDASRGDIGNKLQPLFYVNVVPTEGNELNDSIPSVIEKGKLPEASHNKYKNRTGKYTQRRPYSTSYGNNSHTL